MEIKNCKKCGRIFNYIVGPVLCPRCAKGLEEKFQEVKAYIYDNPGVSISQVSDELEVSVNQLKQWIREERLQFVEGSVTDVFCESCGKQILSGRFCNQCKNEMVRNLTNVYKTETKEKENSNARMRFLK